MLSEDLQVFDDVDERLFHLPTIHRFMGELPLPDLSDYESATGPLYHLLMAAAGRVLSLDLMGLRGLNLAIAIALVLLVHGWFSRRTGPWTALALVSPLAASPYFLGAGVRLSTDNFALLWVVVALALVDAGRGPHGPRVFGAAAAGALAAVTRQFHVWTGGLLVLGAILRRRWALALWGLLPMAALTPLLVLWGGPVPPSFSMHGGGLNTAVPPYIVSLLGLLGLFFGPWLLEWWREARHPWRLAALALVLGWTWLLILPMNWVPDPTRFGGSLWSIAARLPTLHGTSLAFWALLPTGVLVLEVLWIRARVANRYTPVAALALWTMANVPSARVYQKYYEPFLLVILGAAVAGAGGGRRLLWPLALGAVFLAVDVARFW